MSGNDHGTPLAQWLAPTYRQMLGSLDNWLAKAAATLDEEKADALMAARLAPDMFPLATQIRFCCVQAWEGIARLMRAEFPPQIATLLEEGRNGGEAPGTLADGRKRISETLEWLDGIDLARCMVAPSDAVVHNLPIGLVFDFTGEQYARDWAMPQFYFHLMTAYAILRSEGVELGKVDYVAHLLPLSRPQAGQD